MDFLTARVKSEVLTVKLEFHILHGAPRTIFLNREHNPIAVLLGVAMKRSRTARDVVPLVDWVWEAMQAEWARHNEKQRASGLAFATKQGAIGKAGGKGSVG